MKNKIKMEIKRPAGGKGFFPLIFSPCNYANRHAIQYNAA